MTGRLLRAMSLLLTAAAAAWLLYWWRRDAIGIGVIGAIEVAQVRNFVRGYIVEHPVRRQHQPPAERQSARA